MLMNKMLIVFILLHSILGVVIVTCSVIIDHTFSSDLQK